MTQFYKIVSRGKGRPLVLQFSLLLHKKRDKDLLKAISGNFSFALTWKSCSSSRYSQALSLEPYTLRHMGSALSFFQGPIYFLSRRWPHIWDLTKPGWECQEFIGANPKYGVTAKSTGTFFEIVPWKKDRTSPGEPCPFSAFRPVKPPWTCQIVQFIHKFSFFMLHEDDGPADKRGGVAGAPASWEPDSGPKIISNGRWINIAKL